MSAAEYRKLVVIVWLTVIASMAAIWGPKAWAGASWDTDDFMRLVQVRDWLDGQAWSDLTQYRLNPPGGTAMHWSRLPDLALAAVTLAISPFISMNDALTVAAMILPPLYFLIFIIIYAAPARMMLGAARSPVGLLVVISGSAMVTQFAPGRVDHHGLQLVMVMAVTALLLLGLARECWRWTIALAGIPIALSIWIGLEMIALIAAWFAALGLVWCRSGGSLAKHGSIAAGIATMIGAVLLLTSVAPAHRWTAMCDALSIMPVGVLALIAGGFALMHLSQRWARTSVTRLLVAALCGGIVAVIFARSFPQCLDGPYDLDPEIVRWWLSNVPEALPLSAQFRTQPFIAIDKLWVPLLGLAYCLWRCVRVRGHGRNLWGALTVMLALSTPLIFWQIRATFGAHVVALIPLAALIAELWQRLGGRSGPRWRRFAILLPVLFAGSAVFWPALEKGYRIASAFAPGKPSSGLVMLLQDCITRDDLPVLADVPPTNTLAYVDVGPVVLFSTKHAVLGGPYHRNQPGLKATIELFRSEDDAWIRDNLRRLGIGLIATCPGPEDMVMYPTESNNGLAERLAAGRMPDYLQEIPDPDHPGLRFYRVLP